MGEDDNGQLNLFGNEHDTLEAGDQFADGDGNVYTIVSMKTSGFSGWLMVKRSIQSKWAGVAYAIKNHPGKDWEDEMSAFIDKKQLIKLENKDDI